jgi:hypothetical protein
LVVDVARPGMETVEGGAAEYHMVRTLEGHHLKDMGSSRKFFSSPKATLRVMYPGDFSWRPGTTP